jgi:hypothetical protein
MKTTTKTKNDNGLADMVKNIADTINSGNYEPSEEGGCSAFDYLQDALDFQWITTNDLQFLGARVLVAFGGPNVWIDTHRKIVEGFWWGNYAKAEIHEDPMGLSDALEDLYLSRLDEAKRRK